MWNLDRWTFLIGFPVVATVMIWWGFVERGQWPTYLHAQVSRALAVNGEASSWATVQVQGRGVILLGEAPDAGALHDVRRRIAATPGVSNVFANTRIRVWGTLTRPTVKPLATQIRRPTLIGTWPANAAEGLSLELAGELYVLGETGELQTNGANCAFTPSAALPDGRYDVEVTAWTAERSAFDQGSHELTIDTVPPPAPHVDRSGPFTDARTVRSLAARAWSGPEG